VDGLTRLDVALIDGRPHQLEDGLPALEQRQGGRGVGDDVGGGDEQAPRAVADRLQEVEVAARVEAVEAVVVGGYLEPWTRCL
jgi:hypothetical protein